MPHPSRYSANPHLVRLAALLLWLLCAPAPAAADGLPPCHQRPTFVDPPWVDTQRFCAELVYQRADNEALAFTALAVGPDGRLYAASPLRGEVWALQDSDGDRLPDQAQRVAGGLTLPSGLAWGAEGLYISGGPYVWRLAAGTGELETLASDLPAAPGQWGGDLVIGADGSLYLSLSAPCMACEAAEGPSILALAPDGSQRRVLARGLRQPSGLTLRQGELWVTDSAGRATPDTPDALHRLPTDSAGAPAAAPALSLPAGSRPFGLAWYAHEALPDLQDSLVLTLHGSRHRVDLRGYALAVVDFDERGELLPPRVILPEDSRYDAFDVAKMNYRGSGFWPERPLGVAVSPEGWLYFSMTGGRILALRPP